jgi:hypothetical protein
MNVLLSTTEAQLSHVAAVAVLVARRTGLDDEAAALGVDQRVALGPIDLVASSNRADRRPRWS